MRQLNEDAAAFFPLLALFPAGIGDEGLREAFGKTRARLIRPIVDRALVEVAPPLKYYYLPAPVRSFASRRLPIDAMDQVAPKVLPYLAGRAAAYDGLITGGQHPLGILCFAAEFPNFEQFFNWGYEQETSAEDPPVSHSARGTSSLTNFFVTADPGDKQAWRYENGLAAARRVGDRLGEADCLKAIGDVQGFRKENEQALRSYQQALELFRQIGRRLGEARCLQAIGDVQRFRDENEQALGSYQQALELFRQIGQRMGEANCLRAIGAVQSFRNEKETALTSYQQALELFRQIGDRMGEANCLHAIGEVQRIRDENQQALGSYQQALELYRQIGYWLGEANCLQTIGRVQIQKGEPREALGCYQRALEIYENVGDRLGVANTLAQIGKMLLLTDDGAKKGVELLNEALEISKQIGDQSGQANVGIALAFYHAVKRDLPKAIEHLQPVADFGKSIGHPLGDEHQAQIDAWRDELESGEAKAAGEG